MNPKAYRLPHHALPKQYDISLDARTGSDSFGGHVTIHLKINESRNSIILHSRDLVLSDATLTMQGNAVRGEIALDPEREVAEITFPGAFPTGEATLAIAFQGKLNKGLAGIYLASDGPEHLLCTQAFATEARTIFPCFDEPAFKARFSYVITTSPDDTVLTNSRLLSVTESQPEQSRNSKSEIRNSRTWVFASTKPMSSYLAAIVIGDIAATQEESVNGTPIRVWAMRGKEQMGEFAHGYTARLLPWYEEYFGVPYHWGKYDQVAVPGFAAGAMENAGLVTFRQGALLMNPQTASWRQEKRIATVVAHEFAHMWFGNLATIKWWDDVWLSEAFAEWMAHKAIDHFSPDYKIWDDFQRLKNLALETDALESTHPIHNPAIETPAEALEMFDVISYMKGCSVLRMLENFLGEEAFRDGLRSYMVEFAEGNAAGADLWRNLQSASSEPVTEMMQGWVSQDGYPLITLSLSGSPGGYTLHVSQRRFYSSPTVSGNVDTLWHVPLVVRYEDQEGERQVRRLLAEREASITLPVSGELKWCYANAGEVGFYRQDLHRDMLDALLDMLDSLSPVEQMGLLSDQWALVRNGSRVISQFLDVLAQVAASDNYGVLEQVVTHLHTIEGLVEDTGDGEAVRGFRTWVGALFREKQAELGYEPRQGELQNATQARTYILDALTTIALDEEALTQAAAWAEKEASDPASVDPNLAPIFVVAHARSGDRELFDRYVEIYKQRRASGASPQETNRYVNSFAFFQAEEQVGQTLQLIEDNTLPQESVMPLLSQMLGKRHAQLAAWGYIKEHWANIKQLGGIGLGGLVESTGQLPASVRDDLSSFFDANLHGEAQMSYERALEAMDQLAELKARTRDDLLAWFKSK
ncbi:MAG TPA: M1 family metallopeptidase [Chloroflexia bacterium]|jgi:puromycin-sensitive aminopeptidase